MERVLDTGIGPTPQTGKLLEVLSSKGLGRNRTDRSQEHTHDEGSRETLFFNSKLVLFWTKRQHDREISFHQLPEKDVPL